MCVVVANVFAVDCAPALVGDPPPDDATAAAVPTPATAAAAKPVARALRMVKRLIDPPGLMTLPIAATLRDGNDTRSQSWEFDESSGNVGLSRRPRTSATHCYPIRGPSMLQWRTTEVSHSSAPSGRSSTKRLIER